MDALNEWTLMFFFAGDNALAPVIVSQLKAIKDAGFEENTDVVVYFDPNEVGVPTRIYHVNRKRKKDPGLRRTMIGDDEDSFVRNMEDDYVKPDELVSESTRPARARMRELLENPDGVDPGNALEAFLEFCRENHPAKHYMLFLVGHGMIVANDAFLPDENPVSAISLKGLCEILRPFSEGVAKHGTFEMLALHSCSMSAVEVAYQLRGTARFMMASEGVSFVGSWPYRQLLKKTFKAVRDAKRDAREAARRGKQDEDAAARAAGVDVEALLEDLYFRSLFNATDYMLTGYSLDLSLCSLDKGRLEDFKGEMQKLVAALKQALRSERGKELILLAHWDAQSYWGENYTDLFDFCRCLRERCDKNKELEGLSKACSGVIRKLRPVAYKGSTVADRFKALVIHSQNFGTRYQYSHGLSIYFPWTRPVENVNGGTRDEEKGILKAYQKYDFTTDFGADSWFSFLDAYFEQTQRRRPEVEAEEDDAVDGIPKEESLDDPAKETAPAFAAARDTFDPAGVLARGGLISSLVFSALNGGGGKPSPYTGYDCGCHSIKNHPQEQQEKRVGSRRKRNVKAFAITEGALEAFKE